MVEITGLSGSTSAMERHEGFLSGISAYPDVRLLGSEDGAWLHRQAGEKMEKLLDSFPRIDAVFAQNDRMASGAYEAALRKHRAGKMDFIGIDALPGERYGLEDILAGRLTASFIYPTGGDRVVQIAMDILQGKEFPAKRYWGRQSWTVLMHPL